MHVAAFAQQRIYSEGQPLRPHASRAELCDARPRMSGLLFRDRCNQQRIGLETQTESN